VYGISDNLNLVSVGVAVGFSGGALTFGASCFFNSVLSGADWAVS